jgi:hypothetical protein
MQGRNGDWMQTYSGRQFWPVDPHPDDIDILDIAHALSMQCRYGGHSKRFYSVAEHSTIMARVATVARRAALLHDASEAYLVDIPRPIKPYLANYKELERRLNECIAKKFGVAYPWPQEVIDLDNRILADEQKQLMGPPPADWCLTLPPLGVKIVGLEPTLAKREFMEKFNELFS